MAQFITRVELHGVNHDHSSYQVLHEAMKAAGFLRTITGSNNTAYHLPTAEYNLINSLTLLQVLELAKAAAATTGKQYSVLTSHINQATWYNLPQV